MGWAGGGGGRGRGLGVGGWRWWVGRSPREGPEQQEAGEEHDKGQQQVRVALRVGAIAEVEPASFDRTRALYCTAGEVGAVGRACQPHRACAPKAVTTLRSPPCVEPLRARRACAGGLLQPSGAAVRYRLRVAAVICGAPEATLVTQPWSLRRGGVRGGSSETCTRASPRRVGPRGCHPPLSPSPAPHASSRSDSAARRRPRRSRPANLAR